MKSMIIVRILNRGDNESLGAELFSHSGPALQRNTLYSPRTCPTAEHPTHLGHAPSRNTLLTLDLPHRGKPTHHRPDPPQNTLLTKDLSHRGTPFSSWAFLNTEYSTNLGPTPPRNTLLTVDLTHRGTPFSLWNCASAKTLLILDLPQVVHPTHSTELDIQNLLQGKGTSDKHYTDRYSDL